MKNMKQALLVAGCLLATTTLFAQTEKGDWAQFGRYAEANKTVKVPFERGIYGELHYRRMVAGGFDFLYPE